MEKVAESQNLVDVAIKQQARLSGVLLGQSEKANDTANNPHWLALDIRVHSPYGGIATTRRTRQRH
jgi:hypothetical protein